MKRFVAMGSASLLFFSCSPVLDRGLMKQGLRELPVNELREAPERYTGKLFILGGLIVETHISEKGSQIEAVYVPVDGYGALEEADYAHHGRFLAVYPKAKGLLDPVVYRKGREITLAGEFVETRKGKIDEMEYVYPVFEIKQIYLWDVYQERHAYPAYPYYYPYPYGWYDPWWRPYPFGPPPW